MPQVKLTFMPFRTLYGEYPKAITDKAFCVRPSLIFNPVIPDNVSFYGIAYCIITQNPILSYPSFYIGQKTLQSKRLRHYKKGRKRRRVETRHKFHDYLGSSKQLQQDIESGKVKIIGKYVIGQAFSKSELNYLEARLIIENGALIREDFYNGFLGKLGRIRKTVKAKVRT